MKPLSNTRITILSFQEATKHYLGFLQTYVKEIIALFILQLVIDQSVEHLSSKFKSGANQTIALIVCIILLSLFSEFFLNNAFLLLASKSFRGSKQLGPKDIDSYSQMIFEEIRVAGEVLMGFLLFIFPGFNRLVDYAWVPFVVLFEDEYKEGKLDALKASRFMARGHFWFLSTILSLTALVSFVADYLITDGESSIFVKRLPVLISAVICILINLYFKLFYCALYRHSRERSQVELE